MEVSFEHDEYHARLPQASQTVKLSPQKARYDYIGHAAEAGMRPLGGKKHLWWSCDPYRLLLRGNASKVRRRSPTSRVLLKPFSVTALIAAVASAKLEKTRRRC